MVLVASMTFTGYRLRAFTATVIAVVLTVSFLLTFLLAGLLFSMVPDSLASKFEVRLGAFGLGMAILSGIGMVLAKQRWLSWDIKLLEPLDRLLGLAFGAIGGFILAGMASFLCFTYPKFDAAFYPPSSALWNPMNFNGPDPILHAPYRALQFVSIIQWLSGGESFLPGSAGAFLAAGPTGQKFYDAYALAEGLKHEQPAEALKAWESFQSRHSEENDKVWMNRAKSLRASLKPFVAGKSDEFMVFFSEVLEDTDLGAVDRAIKDMQVFFPDLPETKVVVERGKETVRIIREARLLAKQNPKKAAIKLRRLDLKYPKSPLRRLIALETLRAYGGIDSGIGPDGSTEEDKLKRAQENALKSAGKFQFPIAIDALKKTAVLVKSKKSTEFLNGQIRKIEIIQKLHLRAIEKIKSGTADDTKVPSELGIGSGIIISATNSYVTFELKGDSGKPVHTLRRWSQLGPAKVRALYIQFLGKNAKGLKEYDQYFGLKP